MINQQLLDYISQQKQQGMSPDAIKNALRSNGWADTDIDQAFSKGAMPLEHVTHRSKLLVPLIGIGVLLLLIGSSYAYTMLVPTPSTSTTTKFMTLAESRLEAASTTGNFIGVKSPYLMEILDWSWSSRPYDSPIYGPVNPNGYQYFCATYANGRLGEAESAMRTTDGKPLYGQDHTLVGPINYLCNDSKEAWAATVPTPQKNYICIDSARTYTTVSSPLVSGQTSCNSTTVTPALATNNFATYQKLEKEWLTSNQAKELAEASFYSGVSSMALEVAMKCDQWPLTNEIVTEIKDQIITVGSVNIIKQNCGRSTPQTFELAVLPQKGIIDCKATIVGTKATFSGCSTTYLNR
ncbi:MAG: hypothetical protein UY89_C0006G0019 [Parcubacteria group bacterium GW2011_GWA1_54_9]|nr:MAG: hypothetical protein UY89_C0006G0019 [Parcubacteria group bacterium GW2011_GWA1_54_9]KKW41292.1 MAG: hypothetical protein UY91_C0022G0014 [Parcubacteria group bacterium GW2011_GWB1_55_9]